MNQIYKSFFARNSSFLSFLPFLIAFAALVVVMALVVVIRIINSRQDNKNKVDIKKTIKRKITKEKGKEHSDINKTTVEKDTTTEEDEERSKLNEKYCKEIEDFVNETRLFYPSSRGGRLCYAGHTITDTNGKKLRHGKGVSYYTSGQRMFDGICKNDRQKEGIFYKEDGTFGCIYKNFEPDDKATAEFTQNPEKANEFRRSCCYFTKADNSLSTSHGSETSADSNPESTPKVNNEATDENKTKVEKIYDKENNLLYCGETKIVGYRGDDIFYPFSREGYGRLYYLNTGKKRFEGLFKNNVCYTGIFYNSNGNIFNVENEGKFDDKLTDEFKQNPEKADDFLRSCLAKRGKETMAKINNEFAQINDNTPRLSLSDLENKSKTK